MSELTLLTTAKVAEALGISRQAVVARVHAGTLEAAFKGEGQRGGYLFTPDVIEDAE